jgi:hypothetical protein
MGILRKIFGPSKDEVWRIFSKEIGARFIEASLWKGGSKVEAKVKNWTLVLDLYSLDGKIWYTRMRAPYVNKDGFRFTLYEASFFSRMGKFFGMQDIEVGNPDLGELKPLFGVQSHLDGKDIEIGHQDFDKDYVIRSNSEARVRALFGNLRIRELIRDHRWLHFEILDNEGRYGVKFPEGVDELLFQVVGEIKDLEKLRSIYELFAETLNHLCHIGSAYEDDPKLSLLK